MTALARRVTPTGPKIKVLRRWFFQTAAIQGEDERELVSDLTWKNLVLTFGLVGDWNEECVPSDLIASRLREAVLLFDKW